MQEHAETLSAVTGTPFKPTQGPTHASAVLHFASGAIETPPITAAILLDGGGGGCIFFANGKANIGNSGLGGVS